MKINNVVYGYWAFYLAFMLAIPAIVGCSEDDKDSGDSSLGDDTSDFDSDSSDTDSAYDSNMDSASASDSSSSASTDTSTDSSDSADSSSDNNDTSDSTAPMYPELWYSVDNMLVYVDLNTSGDIVEILSSSLTGLESGQNSITMLKNGGLVGSRVLKATRQSQIYFVADPPRDGSPASVQILGNMDVMIEAMYTDCDGRLYVMDTGTDTTSSDGNRLLLITGDYLNGDFTYQVVSDWSSFVADIDDMGPGINAAGEIVDANGFAIDSGNIYQFDYEAGTGTRVGQGGKWGIHALGGSLFSDWKPRLYVMGSDATVSQKNYTTFEDIGASMMGPETTGASPYNGFSGLAGPLTNCVTQFTIIVE